MCTPTNRLAAAVFIAWLSFVVKSLGIFSFTVAIPNFASLAKLVSRVCE
jgi:hypothetical protein